MNSNLAAPIRYLLVVLSGVVAGGAYLAAVFLLAMLFPDIFARI